MIMILIIVIIIMIMIILIMIILMIIITIMIMIMIIGATKIHKQQMLRAPGHFRDFDPQSFKWRFSTPGAIAARSLSLSSCIIYNNTLQYCAIVQYSIT